VKPVSLAVWLEEGITEEQEVTVSNGETKQLLFYPYRMFSLDILNKEDSANNVKVMVDSQSLPQASTLEPGRGRQYDAKRPKYWRVALYAAVGETATVRVTATR
jgi:hypothetical protein